MFTKVTPKGAKGEHNDKSIQYAICLMVINIVQNHWKEIRNTKKLRGCH